MTSPSFVAVLFAIVFYGLYAAFVGSVVWALRRRREADRRIFWLTAFGMVLLPVANAVWIVALLAPGRPFAIPLVSGLFVVGAMLLATGVWSERLPLRLFGWSLIAGVALIPSLLVLLLPLPIGTAFLVPEGRARRRILAGMN